MATSHQRVMITGGAGFIGQHLAAAHLADGDEVVVVDNLSSQPLLDTLGEFMHCDVADLTVEDLDGISCIYHLAALKHVAESFSRTADYLGNVTGGAHLLELVRQARTPRLMIGSTCEVYGASPLQPLAENCPLNPRSPYAVSKASVDMLALLYRQRYSLDIRVARLFNVHGPGERTDAVIPAFCASLLLNGTVRIEGTGKQERDFTYVDDMVRGLRALAEVDRSEAIVNLGSGTSYSIEEVAAALIQIHGSGRIQHVGERPLEISVFRADPTRAAQLLSYKASVELRDGLGRTYRWMEQHLASSALQQKMCR